MNFRYSVFEKVLRYIFRKIFPVPKSPWTAGAVDNICAIHLVPPEKLILFFAETLKRLSRLKGDAIGDYLEFGVFNGNSIGSMFLALKSFRTNNVRLFGFDSFSGLPPGAECEDDGVWKQGFYACSFEQMQMCLRERGIDPTQFTWIPGWYEQSLTAGCLRELSIKHLGIVFVDCDTYSSSKKVLEFIEPLATEPFIICLDDWKLNDLDLKGMGEYAAFNEFVERNPQLTFEEITSYNRKSKSFIVIPK